MTLVASGLNFYLSSHLKFSL